MPTVPSALLTRWMIRRLWHMPHPMGSGWISILCPLLPTDVEMSRRLSTRESKNVHLQDGRQLIYQKSQTSNPVRPLAYRDHPRETIKDLHPTRPSKDPRGQTNLESNAHVHYLETNISTDLAGGARNSRPSLNELNSFPCIDRRKM